MNNVAAKTGLLERVFKLSAHNTGVRTEVLAGATTFLTMAYIVLVNPAILSQAGMPIAAVTAATCLAAGVGSILMGLFANYPIALAPGMGLNAYFTFTVVKGMGVPWPVALGCVFISGIVFLVLTFAGVRQLIVQTIPRGLLSAIAAGIGLFIALIGLKEAGIVVANPDTLVGLGDLKSPAVGVALIGLVIIAALQVWRVKGAILIGILAATAVGWATGLVHWQPIPYDFDFSGLVNAPYASPPDQLRIGSVRTRVYRGYCAHNSAVLSVARQMRDARPQMLATLTATPGLDPRSAGKAAAFLDGFFADIADDQAVSSRLLSRCAN